MADTRKAGSMRANPSSYIRPYAEAERGCRAIPYARSVNPATVANAACWLLKQFGIRVRVGRRPKRGAGVRLPHFPNWSRP